MRKKLHKKHAKKTPSPPEIWFCVDLGDDDKNEESEEDSVQHSEWATRILSTAPRSFQSLSIRIPPTTVLSYQQCDNKLQALWDALQQPQYLQDLRHLHIHGGKTNSGTDDKDMGDSPLKLATLASALDKLKYMETLSLCRIDLLECSGPNHQVLEQALLRLKQRRCIPDRMAARLEFHLALYRLDRNFDSLTRGDLLHLLQLATEADDPDCLLYLLTETPTIVSQLQR